jgi:hypothetical protein
MTGGPNRRPDFKVDMPRKKDGLKSAEGAAKEEENETDNDNQSDVECILSPAGVHPRVRPD